MRGTCTDLIGAKGESKSRIQIGNKLHTTSGKGLFRQDYVCMQRLFTPVHDSCPAGCGPWVHVYVCNEGNCSWPRGKLSAELGWRGGVVCVDYVGRAVVCSGHFGHG